MDKVGALYLGYRLFGKDLSCFTEILIEDNNQNKDEKAEKPEISDSKEEKKKTKRVEGSPSC